MSSHTQIRDITSLHNITTKMFGSVDIALWLCYWCIYGYVIGVDFQKDYDFDLMELFRRAFALLIVPVLCVFEKHQFGVHQNNTCPVVSTLIFLTIAFFLYFGWSLSWYTAIHVSRTLVRWVKLQLTRADLEGPSGPVGWGYWC